MYSLVLLTALSAAPAGPQFNGYFRDLFSGGSCSGSCSGACYGSCSGQSKACYGSSCCGGGCCGGGCCGGWVPGSRLRALFARTSCYGSCSGRSMACYGSSCCGGGCGGGGGYVMPAAGGMPDPYPMTGPGPLAAPPTIAPPGVDDGVAPALPRPAGPPPPSDGTGAGRSGFSPGGGARATVVVRLPADARLFADGRALTLASAEREFVSPPLPPGQEFQYTFRVEYVRDGEVISQTRRVAVRAGASAGVEFADLSARRSDAARPDAPGKMTGTEPRPFAVPTVPPPPAVTPPAGNPFTVGARPAAAAPADRARLTVRVPAGVTLYVNDQRNERTDPVREFSTPPLPAGQEFAYLMRAERVRDGRPESQTQRVQFRAGENVSVDFTAWPR